ncbi:BTAD domain-containing putative transcriptional regulator, partial [Streptomyces sp.]|uniref:BTAD domain-containing putative transcriptional regulator n=1 Tax=Streptomyces sp. TaxID=1931 RepID=UPI002D76FAC1
LLPEDGPAEWVQQDREMYRHQAADAAAQLASAELASENPQNAVAAAETCLFIDKFHDTGWQLLVTAYESIGAPAAAERARRRYAATLASLGIGTADPPMLSALRRPPSTQGPEGATAPPPMRGGSSTCPLRDWSEMRDEPRSAK